MTPTPPVLVVIDVQHAFGVGTEWETPGFDELCAWLPDLMSRFPERTVLTRYLPPKPVTDSWVPYFNRYPTMLRDDADSVWDLAVRPPDGAPVIDARSFNKWGTALSCAVGPDAVVYLAGVATECCVLATALAAADAGRAVAVIADACRGTPPVHEHALQVLAAFAPQINVVTAAQLGV